MKFVRIYLFLLFFIQLSCLCFAQEPFDTSETSLKQLMLNPNQIYKLETHEKSMFDHNKFPLFCKLEFKMEKAAKFPIKIRLGEVQAVERKEGKLDNIVDPQQYNY